VAFKKELQMIACIDKEERVTVCGTIKEWAIFLERLNPKRIEKTDEASKAREILLVASAVPFKGGNKHPG
jgi:hypothetical protein